MILLDIDNLNILVLFIIAFISFKGYQADAQVFDSESEDQISQTEKKSSQEKDNEGDDQSQKVNSYDAENAEPKQTMIREEKKSDQTIAGQFQMLNGGNEDPVNRTLYPQVGQNNQGQSEGFGQGKSECHKEEDKVQIEEKMEEQEFEAYENGNENLKYPEFDSIDSSDNADDQNEEDDGNPESPKKLKKIRKEARKLKRELRKQQEFINRVAKQVEFEINRSMQESLERN